jgi:hypothetical protein
MTTRNFRVHNGISVGDIVISASANTITGLTTSAPSADGDVANKKYVDDSILTKDNTDEITEGSTNLFFTNARADARITNALKDEDNMASDSATHVPSQQSVKAYVDSSVSSLSSTTITAGNTSVVVSDSGSDGAVTVTADGNTELVINDTSATFSGNVIVTGDLTINGSTTTVATTNTTIADNIIELNTGISASSNDAGLIIERGSTGNNAFIGWDESADKFTVGTTTATAADKSGGITVTAGTLVANIEGNVTGDVTGNADTATVATTVTAADESSDTSCNVLFVTAATGDLAPKTGTNLTFNSSAGTLTTTTFVGDLTGTATAAQYSDVAERFASDSAYAPGTVVALGGAAEITQVNEEGSDEVFGVISSLQQAAFKMNGGAGNDDTHPYIAMTGRVNVKVIGSVNKGDRLISASVPGYAKAATKAECTAFNVIGRALTSKTESGQGSVLAAVRVSH